MKPPSELGEPDKLYIFPLRTGNPNYLSGTMGELRNSHFHAGIDIKTQGVQGLEVYASASGHVSRIKVSAGGYGNALYVQHPNGTTTVYAHLQKYNDKIQQYVRAEQYRRQSFEVELYPERNQFPLKQGQVVGYSGNTGSSGGPHLHFEIRDGRQRPLNPLKHKFSEIRDNIPPEIRKVALRTMDKNSRINQQLGRFEFNVIRTGSRYTLPVPVEAYGNIGIELLAYDKLNGANNRNGVPCLELSVDGQQAFQQNLDRFSFAETRSILIHTDYETAQKKGQRFVKLYLDDGNQLPFYETNATKGILNIRPDSSYQVQLNLWDTYNNNSQLNFSILGSQPQKKVQVTNHKSPQALTYRLIHNDLVVEAPLVGDNACAYMYANRMRYELEMAYQVNNTAVFVWDMDQGLPDSLEYGAEKLELNYQALIPGGKEFNFFGENIQVHVPATALFDTVFLSVAHFQEATDHNERFYLGEDLYPIRRNITVKLTPSLDYDARKTSVYSVDAKGALGYVGGTWEGPQITFKTRNWGTYTLQTDTVPPLIRALQVSPDRLAFIIKDELSGIDTYRMEINGTWVLMNYDYKRDLIWSEKLDPTIPFSGDLQLKVVDNAGNIRYYRTKV